MSFYYDNMLPKDWNNPVSEEKASRAYYQNLKKMINEADKNSISSEDEEDDLAIPQIPTKRF